VFDRLTSTSVLLRFRSTDAQMCDMQCVVCSTYRCIVYRISVEGGRWKVEERCVDALMESGEGRGPEAGGRRAYG